MKALLYINFSVQKFSNAIKTTTKKCTRLSRWRDKDIDIIVSTFCRQRDTILSAIFF